MRGAIAIAGLALVSAVGCETYEFPPRLIGVGTADCPKCEELVLSETRVPPAVGLVIEANFAFKDDRGALSVMQAFVTDPSGVVLEGTILDDENKEQKVPGFTCHYQSEIDEDLGANECSFSTPRAESSLIGVQESLVTAAFEVDATTVGEWTVEFVATRSDGMQSNRLSNTFDVVEDVGPDTDGDRVDPGTTGSGTE